MNYPTTSQGEHRTVIRPELGTWLHSVGMNLPSVAPVILGVVLVTAFVKNGYTIGLMVGAGVAGMLLLLIPYLVVVRIELDGNRLRYRGLFRRASLTRHEVGHITVRDTSLRGVQSCVLELYARSPDGRGWGKRLLRLHTRMWSKKSIGILANFLDAGWIVSEIGRYYDCQ